MNILSCILNILSGILDILSGILKIFKELLWNKDIYYYPTYENTITNSDEYTLRLQHRILNSMCTLLVMIYHYYLVYSIIYYILIYTLLILINSIYLYRILLQINNSFIKEYIYFTNNIDNNIFKQMYGTNIPILIYSHMLNEYSFIYSTIKVIFINSILISGLI